MANKPKNMLQVRRILQLLSDGHSKREASRQTGTSRNTIDSYELRFQGSGKNYDELLQLLDTDLAVLVYTKETVKKSDPRRKYLNEHLDYFLNELSRTGVTRELLWNEYRQSAPESYSYSQFCDLLSRHSYKKSPVYHNTYIPGDLVEIDFAGKKMSYVDRSTGEVVECPVLVCTLPYSSFSYIEPLASGKLDHLVPAMNRSVEYFGGVPKVTLTDNMRQIVTQSNRYEPSFTLLAEQWSVHYNTSLKATRPAKPKDKPSVEKSVHLSYQRINARMRNETFYSLQELRQRVWDLLEDFNNRLMFKQAISRRDKFTSEEKHLLRELPAEPFILKSRTKAKVKPNYHVILGEDWHQYSVPHQYFAFEEFLFVHAGFNDSDINPFADKYSMIWLCKQTYENPLLMNKIIIHGHRPIKVDICKEIVHSNKNVINLDTGCVYSNMTGFGTLTAIELNTRSLYFA